jgi:hypothetical protein
MKKKVFFAFFLGLGWVAIAQNYTFQGIPWGASKEQVIDNLGQPGHQYNDTLFYYVSVSGYKAQIDITFDHDGMIKAFYTFGRLERLNADRTKAVFTVLCGQLENKYGSYHEVISNIDIRSIFNDNYNNDLTVFYAWHFNNFHLSIVIDNYENHIYINYLSDASWKYFEETVIEKYYLIRLPNNNL